MWLQRYREYLDGFSSRGYRAVGKRGIPSGIFRQGFPLSASCRLSWVILHLFVHGVGERFRWGRKLCGCLCPRAWEIYFLSD